MKPKYIDDLDGAQGSFTSLRELKDRLSTLSDKDLNHKMKIEIVSNGAVMVFGVLIKKATNTKWLKAALDDRGEVR